MQYSQKFKDRLVQRMSGPNRISANALSQEVGVSQSTLSRWVREASADATLSLPQPISTEVSTMQTRRPQDWRPEEKFQVVLEATSLASEDLGGFLRTKGLHESHIEQWRAQMLQGLQSKTSAGKTQKKKRESKEFKELKQELDRKEKALAEAAALLVLKKKAHSIWGDEADNTARNKGR
jgi:hypothetical protein